MECESKALSLIREIPIGMGLYFICRSFIPRLRPDIWTAFETNECVKRIPDRAATTSNCTPSLLPLSRSLPQAFSLRPSILVLPFFPVTSRALCHSIFIHGYSPSYLVDAVDGNLLRIAIQFRISRVIFRNITRNLWVIASKKAFRNVVSILRLEFRIEIVAPGLCDGLFKFLSWLNRL